MRYDIVDGNDPQEGKNGDVRGREGGWQNTAFATVGEMRTNN